MNLIADLLHILTPRQRLSAAILVAAMLVGSALEALAVALILPLFSLFDNPQALTDQPQLRQLSAYLGATDARHILVLGIVLALAFYVAKNVYLTVFARFQFHFVFESQAAVSCRLLRAYALAPWSFHLQRNTAELLRNVVTEVPLVFGNVMNPLLLIVTETLVVGCIITLLMLVDWVSSTAALLLLVGCSLTFYRLIQHKTERMGREQQGTRANMLLWVNQAFGGIKETKVLGREAYFVNAFATHTALYARAQVFLNLVGQLPRFLLEVLIIGAVLLITGIGLWRGQDPGALLPQLALFGVAGYRMMPSLNRIVASITNIRYHLSSLDLVRADLLQYDLDKTTGGAVRGAPTRQPFTDAIELRDVSFRYPNAPEDTLSHVSLTIPKGKSVALVGQSGAGKTTVVDVILGLLRPTGGQVLVDGVDIGAEPRWWQAQVGYIPQSIYLSDDTIRRNVAFGLEDTDIDDEQVWAALRSAQLEEFVAGLADGLDARTGERGVCLSGGQRQRIGIARALYHDPAVLVLDEATSSLDTDTEQEITRAIEQISKKKTMVIIAHRLSTVEHCDIKFEISSGGVVAETVLAGKGFGGA